MLDARLADERSAEQFSRGFEFAMRVAVFEAGIFPNLSTRQYWGFLRSVLHMDMIQGLARVTRRSAWPIN